MQGYDTVEELLNAPEDERLEFKAARMRFGFDEVIKYCCALSNCGGGKIVFGITDRRPRQVVGSAAFEQPERTCQTLMEKLHVRVGFDLLWQDSKRVLVFEVAGRPIGLPVQFEGTAWWRLGDSLVPIPEEERRRIYDEAGFDFSGSVCAKAGIEDLDKDAIDIFRAKWIEKSGNTRYGSLSVRQLLTDCGALLDGNVTYAALVLFGTSAALRRHLPQSEIIFEYRSSEMSGPAQQREEFRESFFLCYDRVWELVNLRNDKQHYQDGLFIFDIPTFNERVVREALLNAVSHRNYQMNGSVFVRQYRDRLVIESPGGLPAGVTLDNIIDRQAPRNRLIAEILAHCGLVERSGQGMNLIYELSVVEAKALPDFRGTDDYLVRITLNGLVLDERMLLLIKKIANDQLATLTTDDFLVIDALFHEKYLSARLRESAKRLVGLGLVEHSGRNRFVLARSLYQAAGKPGAHTRLVGLDKETNKELILKHINESGGAGAPFGELEQVLPNLSSNQIKYLVQELKGLDLIYVVGRTSGAKWHAK